MDRHASGVTNSGWRIDVGEKKTKMKVEVKVKVKVKMKMKEMGAF